MISNSSFGTSATGPSKGGLCPTSPAAYVSLMGRSLRSRIGHIAAQVSTLGGRRRGFFTRYDYVDSVLPVSEPYSEIEKMCADSPFRDFVGLMGSNVPHFQAFGQNPLDPDWGHGMFSHLDGAAAYTAVKKFRPQRIIEIGSGDSTRFLSKAAGTAAVTCIDPAPRREIGSLPVHLVRRVVQNSDVQCCAELAPNDILFIDSSHIMLPGMDADIIFNRIFPRLQSGVIVHVHDIFLPFDYPAHWSSRNWNEQNALAGWLFGSFDIVYPGHYVARRHPQILDEAFAAFPVPRNAGSMWLRKR